MVANLRRLLEQIKPASLDFRARDARVRATGGTRIVAGALWIWRRLRLYFWSSPYAFFPQLVLGLVLVWFTPPHLSLPYQKLLPLYPLNKPEDVQEFLRAIWQVEASVLALSIAVIIFAFQAVSSSELGVELGEFAEDTHLFPVFYLGIVGLVLVGFVQLGIGNGVLDVEAALVATVVSGSTLLTLAWLFANTIGALAPEQLQRRRTERFERAAGKRVDREVLENIAYNLLEEECQRAGVDFRPLLPGAVAPGAHEVRANRGGNVRDVNLRKLRSLANRVRQGEQVGLSLLVSLGSRVAEGQVIIILPPWTDERAKRLAQRVVRIVEETR